MNDTEVEGMSVDAKLILKGVEPFSIDVVGAFVLDTISMRDTEVEGMSVDAKLILKGVVVLEFGLEAYVGKASFSVEPVVGETVLVFKEFVEAVEEEYDAFVWESCVKDSVSRGTNVFSKVVDLIAVEPPSEVDFVVNVTRSVVTVV